MKISGFTFIRNGTMLGYPFVPAIRSILPLCDEVVVNVPRSTDDTLARVGAIGNPTGTSGCDAAAAELLRNCPCNWARAGNWCVG